MKNIFVLSLFMILVSSCNSDDEGMTDEGDPNLVLATVSIYPISNIYGDSVGTGGDILDDGGSEIFNKGICYSTTPNPTIDDSKRGSGSGNLSFVTTLTDLEFNTTYYARAYAINETGAGYSEELSFMTNNSCSQNIYNSQITITTQSALNAFAAANYCEVGYDLELNEIGTSGSDPIVSLTPLASLRTIGDLWIRATHLTDLSGLENLVTIKRSIHITENTMLQNIDALQGIVTETNRIFISDNTILQNLDGLSGIPALVATDEHNPLINLFNNIALENIDGLSNIQIEDSNTSIYIGGSNALTNLNGLSNFSGAVDDLVLVGLPMLSNTSGISNITTINNFLTIEDCSAVVHLDDFTQLESVGEVITLVNNGLTDFCGLRPLFTSGGFDGYLNIANNPYNPSMQAIINGNCRL